MTNTTAAAGSSALDEKAPNHTGTTAGTQSQNRTILETGQRVAPKSNWSRVGVAVRVKPRPT